MSRSASQTDRESHGERRRRSILATAVDLASAEGLEGLSIGRLAKATRMSRSGVFAHFGSKEELQLAAIDAACADFENAVLLAAADAPAGLARLRVLLDAWVSHVEGTPLRGGCFFFATSAEFGSRPGRVRDRLAKRTGAWVAALAAETTTACRQGELRDDTASDDLAFQLHAFVQEANWARELLGDSQAFARARRAIESTLARHLSAPTTRRAPSRTRARKEKRS